MATARDARDGYTCYPGRPDYVTYAASVSGLPVGAYPESRPAQAVLADAAKSQIREAYRRFGLIED